MSGKDEGQEKTEEPTPERIRKARQDGDVAKSNDVSAAAAYVGLLAAMFLTASSGAMGAGEALYGFMARPHEHADLLLTLDGESEAAAIVGRALLALSPMLLLPFAFTLTALLTQQAIVFAPKKIEFKGNRLSLVENFKNKFGLTGMVEFAKSAVKMFTVSIILWLLIMGGLERIITMPLYPGTSLPEKLSDEGMRLLVAATAVAVIIGCIDYVWIAWDHRRKLRMSHQEIKEEGKESEGDPHMKQARRQRAREIASNRMMNDVPKASVIVTNPTHFAVALRWTREEGGAPVCVAKGVDEIAARIREIATENDIPIYRDPPTARAIFDTVEIGDEVQPDHYRAVAVAVRFAEDIAAKAKARR